jgi:hypothetical protein
MTYVWRTADLNSSFKNHYRSNDLQILYYSSTNERIRDSGTQNKHTAPLNLSFASLPAGKYIEKLCET